MMRWIHPHELERQRQQRRFDPIVEGDRYGLSRERSLAIWSRVCMDATRDGRCDLAQAERSFHEIAARGGRSQPDVGRRTRAATDGGPEATWTDDERYPRTPGRETLVTVESRSRDENDAHEPAPLDRLPTATLDRMERAYGRRFDDVEIHTDSAEVPNGQQAYTRGHHIYFERGAFNPDHEHGEHVIAHELAHVAQQSLPRTSAFATRAAIEADAHQAALAALAGRAASVHLFAPAAAALGFSEGQAPHAASREGAQASPSSARAPGRSSTRAAPRGGGAIPRAPAASTKAAAPPAGAAALASAAPRRGAPGDGLRLPEAPTTLTPAAAGRLQTVQAENQGNAAATTTLPTGQQQTDVGRAAVVEPQAEQDARAQHGVVTGVDDRPPPSPEIEEACARIRQVIRAKRPPDEDKLVEARPREMAQEAGEQMSADVEQRAGTVRQGYADMQQPPAGAPSTTPVPPTLPPPHAQTQGVDAGAAAPDPMNRDDVSLDADVADQKKQIEDAGMNTEPGKLVKDGPIGDARGGADELSAIAKTDPDKVVADQAKAIATAQGDMRTLQQAADKALADARAGTVAQMATHTAAVKGSEEQQRAQAGERMKGIFDRTQKSVDALLQPLAGKAVARWDAGVAQLSTDFEASLADVKRRIDERHSGFGGGLVKAWDSWTGLPDWATQGYDRAEAKFGDGATNLIRDISRDVNAVIEDCKGLIRQARKDIDDIVKSLPASLQTWAQGEAAKLNQQLDALDTRVDQAQKGINKDLIHRADTAVQQVRERVHELREAAKGMLAKIAAAIAEFVKDPFKAIVNGLLRVLGIAPDSFWGLVDRLGDVVGAIAKDPVRFGKTLISGAAQGFQQFFAHFPTHLKEILMGWLFGTLGTVGVPMPTDFSAQGILPTVLGIMGIDSGMILSMLGADGSDPAEMAEIHHELSGVLSGDPHALVALLRDHFDPASLIPMIKEAAMSFLIQALITQVAPRIAAMLVPGGAILQAVEAIFKVLMWVVSNAARIFTLIESLVATASQAVAGNTSGVAAGVESGLVQIIVLVIDFLAGYIGLGGIGAKLKGVLTKLSGKLKGALKKALDALKKRAKAKSKPKRDHHKPADHPGASRPTHDDRDPQKAKDDAKDPRNHMRDPDDKDPRNHHHDGDDKDPRNHKPGDEPDPKKPKDDDDPKKKHDHDLAEARRAARTAADRGWAAARAASEHAALSKAELEAVLARAEHSTPKAKVTLDIQDRGTTWTVGAEVKIDTARATDTEGTGWIARGDGGQHRYAASNLSAFTHKVVDDAKLALRSPPHETENTTERQYQAKLSQSEQVESRGQAQLEGKIRGLALSIKLEPLAQAAHDHKVTTHFKVTPGQVTASAVYDLGGASDDGEIGKHLQFSAGHESHTLWVDTSGGHAVVMLASTPRPMSAHLADMKDRRNAIAAHDATFPGKVDGWFQQVESLTQVVVQEADAAKRTRVDTDERAKADAKVEAAETALRSPLTELLKLLGVDIPKEIDPPVSITFNYHGELVLPENPSAADHLAGFTRAKMVEQLEGQQRGLNALTVGEWQKNRERYTERGRAPTADRLQNAFRADQRRFIVDALELPEGGAVLDDLVTPSSKRFIAHCFAQHPEHKTTGFPAGTVGGMVDQWLGTQNALHDPDMIAGGYPDALQELGSRRINFSIGSQWKKLVPALDHGVHTALHEIPSPLWNGIGLRVTLNCV